MEEKEATKTPSSKGNIIKKTTTRKVTTTFPQIQKKTDSLNTLNVNYKSADKRSFIQFIRETVPKEAIPTKKTGYATGAIILLVVLLGIAQFPFGKMLSGSTEIEFAIGIPWDFFVMDLMKPNEMPIKIGGLIGDMLIYILIGYIIDIILNIIINTSIFESKEEKKKHPGFYKGMNKEGPKKNFAEKATSKMFNEQSPGAQKAKQEIQKTQDQIKPIKTTSEMLPPKPEEKAQEDKKPSISLSQKIK